MSERLNWGCGPVLQAGWVNLDREPERWGRPDVVNDCSVPGEPLPWTDDVFDVIVANHSLQMVPWHFVGLVLREWRRVLRPGGVARVLVPDTLAAFDAHARGDHRWFPIADHVAASIDAKLSAYLTWYSESRCCHTVGSLIEHLTAAGFEHAEPVHYGETSSPFPEIVELDSRKSESLIVEAC
jgi:SAM-dependent methyltransferase